MSLPPFPSSPPPARSRRLPTSTVVGLVAAGICLLLFLATSGVPGFLMGAGLLGLGTGLYAAITGRQSWARLPSRAVAGMVVAAAFIALVIGGTIAPRQVQVQSFVDAPPSDAASTPSASAPEATPTPTRSPTPRPTTTPTPTPSATVPPVVAAPPVVEEPVAPVPFSAPVAEAPAAPPPAAPSCDPNYSSPCVPIDSDVDCAGGSGNGPSYVVGPVYIVGSDPYDLDRDGDGIACDS